MISEIWSDYWVFLLLITDNWVQELVLNSRVSTEFQSYYWDQDWALSLGMSTELKIYYWVPKLSLRSIVSTEFQSEYWDQEWVLSNAFYRASSESHTWQGEVIWGCGCEVWASSSQITDLTQHSSFQGWALVCLNRRYRREDRRQKTEEKGQTAYNRQHTTDNKQ